MGSSGVTVGTIVFAIIGIVALVVVTSVVSSRGATKLERYENRK